MPKVKARTAKQSIIGVIWKKSGSKKERTTNMMRAGRFSHHTRRAARNSRKG